MTPKTYVNLLTTLLAVVLSNAIPSTATGNQWQGLQSLITFPIAVSSGPQTSFGVAFDGTNYLVAIEGDGTNLSPPHPITAQRVSRSGVLVGNRILIGQTGFLPAAAFDGTNYLLVWTDPPSLVNTKIYGQLIDPSGGLIETPFIICQTTGRLADNSLKVVFDGDNYLVVWSHIRSSECHIYARFVSKTRALLFDEIQVTEAQGIGAGVACDGSNCLVGWRSYQAGPAYHNTTRGQLISKSGSKTNNNFIMFDDTTTTQTPGNYPILILYNGSEYVVSLSDKTADDHVRHFIKTVTTTGTVNSTEYPLYEGQTFWGCWLNAFDGQYYLATLCQGWGGPPVTARVRFFDSGFNPLGGDWVTVAETGNNKIPIGPFFLYDGFRYFGILDYSNADFSLAEVYGLLLTGPSIKSLYLPLILKN